MVTPQPVVANTLEFNSRSLSPQRHKCVLEIIFKQPRCIWFTYHLVPYQKTHTTNTDV